MATIRVETVNLFNKLIGEDILPSTKKIEYSSVPCFLGFV